MPEKPEIRIAAARIAKEIAFKPIKEIFFAFEHLKPYEDILVKQLVTGASRLAEYETVFQVETPSIELLSFLDN